MATPSEVPDDMPRELKTTLPNVEQRSSTQSALYAALSTTITNFKRPITRMDVIGALASLQADLKIFWREEDREEE